MRISSQGADRARFVALSGAFLCAALMLTLAENLAFPAGLLPIPGAKIGLANSAILLCTATLGRAPAFAVSMARVLLMFILFGNGSSAIYSLSGALLSFIGIAFLINNRHLSFIGKSVISAVLHNIAQVICASAIIGEDVMLIMPVMVLTALGAGVLTGIIINLIFDKVRKMLYRGTHA